MRPSSIQVDDRCAAVVDDLLDASTTFAQQCQQVAGAALVAIRTLPRDEESCCRARAAIRRYDSGALIAVIELPAFRTRREYAELLGHEFEHILEQIDNAVLGPASEIPRARVAGLTVLSEAVRAGW